VRMARARRVPLMGYPDAVTYVMAARGSLHWNPYRPVGYPVLLRALHRVDRRASAVLATQHALGIATAGLLYCTTARFARCRSVALLPAATVLFGGSQVLLERSMMAEAPYTFLLAGSLYCSGRSVDSAKPCAWAAASGLGLGLSSTLRSNGVLAVPILTAWTTRAIGIRAGATLALSALGVLLAYVSRAHAATGHRNLTRANAFTLYARLAPLAHAQSVPDDLAVLREDTPPEKRGNATWYMFDATSPARRRYGELPWPLVDSPHEAYSFQGDAPLGRFALAVLKAQPRDYLRSIAVGMVNHVRPYTGPPHAMGWDHDKLMRELSNEAFEQAAHPEMEAYFTDVDETAWARELNAERYARRAKLEGPPTAALTALMLAGLVRSAERERHGASLFAVTTLGLATLNVASLFYDVRYVTPLYGPLAAGAALGLDRILPNAAA